MTNASNDLVVVVIIAVVEVIVTKIHVDYSTLARDRLLKRWTPSLIRLRHRISFN